MHRARQHAQHYYIRTEHEVSMRACTANFVSSFVIVTSTPGWERCSAYLAASSRTSPTYLAQNSKSCGTTCGSCFVTPIAFNIVITSCKHSTSCFEHNSRCQNWNNNPVGVQSSKQHWSQSQQYFGTSWDVSNRSNFFLVRRTSSFVSIQWRSLVWTSAGTSGCARHNGCCWHDTRHDYNGNVLEHEIRFTTSITSTSKSYRMVVPAT